MTLKLVQIVN